MGDAATCRIIETKTLDAIISRLAGQGHGGQSVSQGFSEVERPAFVARGILTDYHCAIYFLDSRWIFCHISVKRSDIFCVLSNRQPLSPYKNQEVLIMRKFGRSWIMVTAVLAILAFVALPASAATPPFFGPPGMHANTLPGTVDVSGASQNAFVRDTGGGSYFLQSPWAACQGPGAFTFQAASTGAVPGKFDQVTNLGRSFTVNQTDANGNYIGGSYQGWFGENGTLTLGKSAGTKPTYDQVLLVGTKVSGPVYTVLSLVQQGGYIGVSNLASLGVINNCGGANANSQILVPMGTDDNGQPTVIPDLNGDGVPDPQFLPGPPISGVNVAAPIPTLTEWGLIALTLILLIVGLRFLRNNASPVSA